MPAIVLAACNARFLHASFGLRCLRANLGGLRGESAIVEFTVQQRPVEMAEEILALRPRIVGLGVYIWNVAVCTELVALLKRLRPGLTVVLGGPEVSHEWDRQPVVQLADATITGEADLAFADLCRAVLRGGAVPARVIHAPPPALADLVLPYDEYTDADIAHRLVHVEASRGCPFECEFCLSSLDVPVRQFPLEPFLAALDRLLARGVRHFKFVDRTFNLHPTQSRRILEFFLARLTPGLFLHFEMVPDRLPEALRDLLARFPAGSLQLEVGVQTFNPAVAAAISRRQDYARLEDNLRFLRARTHAHLHADLIVGLPGETWESFAAGFDRLVALGPQEIQVGLLKRLRGAPIARHEGPHAMVFSPVAPYELLESDVLPFAAVQRLRRLARWWDLVGNSGNFRETLPLFWTGGASPFAAVVAFADWAQAAAGRGHGLSRARLVALVLEFLTTRLGVPLGVAGPRLAADCARVGEPAVPAALRPFLAEQRRPSPGRTAGHLAVRQARHQAE